MRGSVLNLAQKWQLSLSASLVTVFPNCIIDYSECLFCLVSSLQSGGFHPALSEPVQ